MLKVHRALGPGLLESTYQASLAYELRGFAHLLGALPVFAVNPPLRSSNEVGSARFPRATELMITANEGGSNSSRNRLWKNSLPRRLERLHPTTTLKPKLVKVIFSPCITRLSARNRFNSWHSSSPSTTVP
jgi:hypothetical protein